MKYLSGSVGSYSLNIGNMGRVTSDLLLALVRATGRDVEDMRIVPHRQ